MADRVVFQDKEGQLFYRIEFGCLSFAAVLLALRHWWAALFIPAIGAFGILVFGPPLRAEILPDGSILFVSRLRRNRITADSLLKVKDAGAYDYAAHLVLRNKGEFMVMYRLRKYENAPQLARAVLNLLKKAPNAKVTENARMLLQQVAGGNTSPLQSK